MMNGFTRYVLWQLLAGMALVTMGLTFIIWLTQSLRFVEMIVNRGLSAGKFVYLIMLLLPNFLSVILPIALFTVIVFTYSKLISDSELVVMRAAGVSQSELARPAIILSVVVVIAAYALNIFLVPQSYRMFREMQWDIRYSYSHVMLQEGAFNNVSTDITVYIRERTSGGQLLGILVHDTRDKEKPYTLLAERGALMESDTATRVVMFKGSRQEVDKKTNQLSILYFDRYIFEMEMSTSAGMSRYREARERTMGELFDLKSDKELSPRDYGKFTVEAHKRLTSPLSALGYALVGLACLISGGFSRRTQTQRAVIAIAIMVSLQIMSLGLENLCARNLKLIPLMYAGVLFPILAGYLLMVRQPRLRVSMPEPEAAA
ncbi:MAG: LPS export ABC transporter permease LptF [Rhodospirillales bacterium]